MNRAAGALVVIALQLVTLAGCMGSDPPPSERVPSHPASPYHGARGRGNPDPYGVGPHLPRPPTGPLTGDL